MSNLKRLRTAGVASPKTSQKGTLTTMSSTQKELGNGGYPGLNSHMRLYQKTFPKQTRPKAVLRRGL